MSDCLPELVAGTMGSVVVLIDDVTLEEVVDCVLVVLEVVEEEVLDVRVLLVVVLQLAFALWRQYPLPCAFAPIAENETAINNESTTIAMTGRAFNIDEGYRDLIHFN